jgi:hypothetical protein
VVQLQCGVVQLQCVPVAGEYELYEKYYDAWAAEERQRRPRCNRQCGPQCVAYAMCHRAAPDFTDFTLFNPPSAKLLDMGFTQSEASTILKSFVGGPINANGKSREKSALHCTALCCTVYVCIVAQTAHRQRTAGFS